jgi:hypothetical protein
MVEGGGKAMIDPASYTALRRSRESAQSVDTSNYDAPPDAPDIYSPETYPPGFGPQAQPPAKQWQIFPVAVGAGAGVFQKVEVSWENPEYFMVTIDGTAGLELVGFFSSALTGAPLFIIGPKGRAKIPLSPIQRTIYLFSTSAAAIRGICAFTRGCDYESVY